MADTAAIRSHPIQRLAGVARRRRVIALVALAALVLAELTLGPPRDRSATPATIVVPIGIAGATVPRDDLSSLAAIVLARPLFAATRRPPIAAFEAAAPDSVELPVLSGTIITGVGRLALIVLPGAPRPVAVREGERAGRFLVRHIGPGEVTADGPHGPVALRLSMAHPAESVTAVAEPVKDPRIKGPQDQDE